MTRGSPRNRPRAPVFGLRRALGRWLVPRCKPLSKCRSTHTCCQRTTVETRCLLLCPPLHFQSTTLDFSSHASQGGQGFVATLLKRASLKISSRCHAAQTSGHYGNESRNCSRPYACTASLRLRGFR